MKIARTPKPPYYSVIFTSKMTDKSNGYSQMSDWMNDLVNEQPGFLGVESARNELGITVSYWESLEAIKNWKKHQDHLKAQAKGKQKWYSQYTVRIAKVEHEYSFEA
ncbi:MAG: heme-degrading monooxygenase HmoA [Sphingobacteriales bacterium]|jgi:heme-degrading monooxygenase HmoA